MTCTKIRSKKIDPEIVNIIAQSVVTGNQLVLPRQLDRETYEKVNRVLVSLGGKWDRKRAAHVFDLAGDELSQKVDGVLETGEFVSLQAMGFFPTPEPLALDTIILAHIRPGMMVLEPSAGAGALAKHIYEIVGESNLVCVEIDRQKAADLSKRFRICFAEDFLTKHPETPSFDRVVMNPPFSGQQDIDHVLHAWKFLKGGGRLVAIMAAGFTFRENAKSKKFRELVDRYGSWAANPPESFKASGTSVNTVTVVLDKPEGEE